MRFDFEGYSVEVIKEKSLGSIIGRIFSESGFYSYHIGSREITLDLRGENCLRINSESRQLIEIQFTGNRQRFFGGGYEAISEAPDEGIISMNDRCCKCWFEGKMIFMLPRIRLRDHLRDGIRIFFSPLYYGGEVYDQFSVSRDFPVLLYCVLFADYGNFFSRTA